MVSLLHDLSIGEDNDPKGISDGGQTMGDDEDRSSFRHYIIERKKPEFSVGVQSQIPSTSSAETSQATP